MYLEAYLNNVADDDTKVKYFSVLPDTADQIYNNFKTALKEECDRPLFVAVYTELWIYKDDASVSPALMRCWRLS